MKLTAMLFSALLAVLPMTAFAMCGRDHKTANVCETGFVWDEASQTCVEADASS